MKKIINNALYNTGTAKQIGTWSNGLYSNDFAYCAETLYRTKSGKYFLYGEGGPKSQYGEWHGNSGGWGEQIRPYTPQEAREWAEERLDADEYAAEFGEPEEAGDDQVPLFVNVSASAKAKLDAIKRDTGKTLGQIITDMVSDL